MNKMINRIKKHEILSSFLDEKCCENNVCVTLDESYSSEDYVIIKVDEYYNSLGMEKTPPSVDCLIVRKCDPNGYGLTLVELKDISSGRGFSFDNLKGKFETTLNDFIKRKFRERLDTYYWDIQLFFVSNQELYKRDLGLKLEALMNVKFEFNERKLMIQPRMPHPTIKKCYSK